MKDISHPTKSRKLRLNKRWISFISDEIKTKKDKRNHKNIASLEVRSFLCLCSNVPWYRKKGDRIQDRIKSDLIASKWLLLNVITMEVISYV